MYLFKLLPPITAAELDAVRKALKAHGMADVHPDLEYFWRHTKGFTFCWDHQRNKLYGEDGPDGGTVGDDEVSVDRMSNMYGAVNFEPPDSPDELINSPYTPRGCGIDDEDNEVTDLLPLDIYHFYRQAGFLLAPNGELDSGVIISDDHGAAWEDAFGSLSSYLNSILYRSGLRAAGSGPGRGPDVGEPNRKGEGGWSVPLDLDAMFRMCTKKGGGEDGYVDFLRPK